MKKSLFESNKEYGSYGKIGTDGPFRWKSVSFGECLTYSLSNPAVPVSAVVLLALACTGDWAESLLVLAILVAFVIMSAAFKYRAEKVFENANSKLISPVSVIRDGIQYKVPFYEVTEGDVIVLEPGDIVPADAVLLSKGKLRVVEQYFDYDKSMKSARVAVKSISPDREISEKEKEEAKTILAGSTVISGKGRAAVTAVGYETAISERLGGMKIAPAERRTPSVKRTLSNSRLFSGILTLSLVPIMLIYLIFVSKNGNAGPGFLPVLLSLLGVVLGSFGETDAFIFDCLSAQNIVASEVDPDGPNFYLPSLTEEIAEADTAVIFDRSLIGDLNPEVRSVFFNGEEYSGPMVGSGNLTPLSELMLILRAVHMSANAENDTDVAFDTFAMMLKTDRDFMLRNISGIKPKYGFTNSEEYSAEVSYKGELPRKVLLTLSKDRSLIKKARFYRDVNEGLSTCDIVFCENAESFIKACDRQCLTTLFVTTTENGSDITVIEGICAVGGTFPEMNAEVSSALSDMGMNTLFIIEEEKDKTAETAGMSGLSSGMSGVAIQSEYLASGKNINEGFDGKKIFVGFGEKGTETVFDRLKSRGSKFIAVVNDMQQMKRAVKAGATVVSVRDSAPASVNISAAASLSSSSEHSETSGLASLFALVGSSAGLILKNVVLRRFLAFRTSFLICLSALALLTGKYGFLPNPTVLFLSVLLTDLMVCLVLDRDTYVPETLIKTTSFLRKSSYLSDTLLYISTGLFSALGLALTGVFALKSPFEGLDGVLSLSALAVTVVAFGAIRAGAVRDLGLSKPNYVYGVFVGAVVVCVLLNAALPYQNAFMISLTGLGCENPVAFWLPFVPMAVSFGAVFGASFLPKKLI